MRIASAFCCFSICASLGVASDDSRPQPMDRIVARVGDSVLTMSEVEESAQLGWVSSLPTQASDLKRIYQKALERLIDEELLFQGAVAMGVRRPDEDEPLEVESMIDALEARYESRAAFQDALHDQGMTIDRLRDRYRERRKRQWMISQALQHRFTISDEDVEVFAAELEARSGTRSSLHLRHILIECDEDATPDEVEEARERAIEALARTRGGMSFADAARLYSDHEATRDDGGDLGVMNVERLAPALEAAAEQLEPGQVSQPIRSGVGFHILYLQSRRTPRMLLFSRRMSEERKSWLEELRGSETVELLPGFLEDLEDEPAPGLAAGVAGN